MAADYEIYAYTSDEGAKHPIRLSTDGALAQKTVPSATGLTSDISARVGGSRRALGLVARGVRLKRSTGTGAAKKSFFTFLPVLLPADFDGAEYNKGAAISIGATNYQVSKRVPEARN